tara:strand:+ start:73 stop:1005 length:933 start_codon:yes stop_codon:yes gene_type:complete
MSSKPQIWVVDGSLDPTATVVSLPHPLDAARQCLFLQNGPSSLLEIQRARVPGRGGSSAAATSARPPPSGSWFVGDRVISDGALLLATAFDARLLLLPMLTSDMRYFRALDELSTQGGSGAAALQPLLRGAAVERISASLREVCDAQEGLGPGALPLLRLNATKLIALLKTKVERTAAALVRCDDGDSAAQAAMGGANSASFVVAAAVVSKEQRGASKEERARMQRDRRAAEAVEAAVLMLGEWVEERWILELRTALGLVSDQAKEAAAIAAAGAVEGGAAPMSVDADPTVSLFCHLINRMTGFSTLPGN